MEELDRNLQKRVWQRVQGTGTMPPLGKLNIKPWILSTQENAADYQSLAQTFQGREAEQLRRLHQESLKCIACLKGICRLRGEKIKLGPLPQGQKNRRNLLEGCYHREKLLCQQLEGQANEPDHGIVFLRLAQQSREHCMTILEILGKME